VKNDDSLEGVDARFDQGVRRMFADAQELDARPDDDARIQAAIDRALQIAGPTPRPSLFRRGRWVYLAAAALAVGALAYAAGHGTAEAPHGDQAPESANASPPASGIIGASVNVAEEPKPTSQEPALPVVTPESLPTAPAARVASTASPNVAPRPTTNVAAPSAAMLGPAELFARANDARRANDTKGAIALYEELQTRFPSSREASTSRVALGRLLLDRAGEPARAQSLFRAYLENDPSGALAEEARMGRALAAMRLGDRAGERAAWLELLDRHPDSVHTERARQRLVDLLN
jgi:TolA-binding protein